MGKQENNVFDERYYDTFPTILRNLMENRNVTQKDLANVVDVRPQTISQYKNGLTQPTADNLLKIAQFFHISVDYLLTGLSSDNSDINKELGLTEDAIKMLKRASCTENFEGMPTVMDYTNKLLSDNDFYQFLQDLIFKVNAVQSAESLTSEQKKKLPQFDYVGYSIWNLQILTQEFIRKQLAKLRMEIEKE